MPVYYYLLLSIVLGFIALWITAATPGLFDFLRSRASEIRLSHPAATGMWLVGVLLPLWGAFTFASLKVVF